jgi:mucin-19
MAVTRINNNQITDASAGNIYLGINANTKLQNYSITSQKIANNLTYGSDLTISGNLTVNGTTTAVDTVNTLILDPLITLADGQTSGAPTLDIGTIGLRGSQNSAVLAWKESQLEFVTALSTTTVSNTTFTISSYANLHTGNFIAQGTTSLVGNVIGTAQFTGNIVSGNLLTPGLISATGTITGGNIATGGTVSSTGNVTGGNILTGGNVSATGNITGGNIISGNAVIGNINVSGDITVNSLTANTYVSAIGNVQAGNVRTAGLISATGNITGGNVSGTNLTGTNVSVTGTATAASTVGGVITGSSVSVTGGVTAASVAGGVITGTSTSVTGTQTAASTVGGVITGSSVSVTGGVTAASVAGGVITGTSTSVTGNTTAGNVLTGGQVSATANVTGGNIITGGIVSATANVTGGNVLTGGQVSATANVTGGNIITGGIVSATGNINGSNLNITGGIFDTSALTITTATGDLNLSPAGNVNLGTRYVNNVINPVQNQDAATKIYVDDRVSTAISYHEAVLAATTTTLAATTGGTVTYAQPNGVSNGVGATLTTTGSFNLIDTANVQTVGTRILVKDQANAVQNGVYVYSNATVITRSSDADTYGAGNVDALGINDYFFTTSGNINKGTAFIVDAPAGTITFGTSNIQFAIFSQSQVYSANTAAGLILNGTVFSAKVDNNTTAFDGGGNISVKASANLTTPNIGAATGTSLSVTGTVTAASTVGGVITGTSVSVTGGVTAASVSGGVITGTSASLSGNVTGGNVLTGGVVSATGNINSGANIVATSNVIGGNISTAGVVTATGNVTGGNVLTGGLVSATGNGTFGNISTAGTVSAASLSVSGNITGGNILSGGSGSFTGNVTAANFFGNISGNIDAAGANTQVQFNDTGDILGASTGFTFNKTANLLTVGGQITSTGPGNATTGGGQIFLNGAGNNRIDYNSNGTGAPAFTTRSAGTKVTLFPALSASTADYAIGIDSATLWSSVPENTAGFYFKWYGATTEVANISGTGVFSAVGNVSSGGNIRATANITGANLILTSGIIDGPAAGRVTINGSDIDTDFAVDGDTLANVFYVDAGTGTASFGNSTQTTNAIVAFNTSTSVLFPVGNTQQRPATGVTGMLRFNTTNNAVEVYDNNEWTSVGVPVFTVIADQQFNGDGLTVAFTLGSTQTTNSCIVSINGVVQIPTLAYSVSGTDPTCVLTFTEAPAPGDIIDVRQITTTTSVTSIANSSGNAVIAVSDTSATTTITGDLTVTGNATVLGSVAADQILNGSSDVNIPIADGTVHIDVGGVGNVAEFFTTGVVFKGNVTPFANVTYNLGNTTNRWNDLWLANSTIYLGNSRISANATSLILTNPAGGQTVLSGASPAITGATVSVTGNVTGGNILTGGLISVTGNITGGNILGGANVNATTHTGTTVSVTGNIDGGNLRTAGLISATGSITTAGDISITGNIVDGAALTISTGSNGNITLAPNGSGVVVVNADIRNGQANATGNIGSATSYFNTIFAKATSAQYADLAEKYTADADYAPGTVVQFGGSAEVTLCVSDACSRVAGVISTNPSYRMNDGLVSAHTAMVALTGRVPTKVTGTVRKGDMMVSAGDGVARAEADPAVGTVIGKALADSEGDAVIEVVVGRV